MSTLPNSFLLPRLVRREKKNSIMPVPPVRPSPCRSFRKDAVAVVLEFQDARLSRTDLGLYTDANEEALARVVAFCRKYGGAKLGSQLYHSGRKGSITTA